MLMIIAILVVVGLCLGSFVNALVWRVHEQATEADRQRPDGAYLKRLSVLRGKSMCPHCRHELHPIDLIPLVSWLALGGKCRYCGKAVSAQYPLVELLTAALFAASYIWWPNPITGSQTAVFVLWLLLLTGLIALLVFDLRWFLLPNRILYPLAVIAAAQSIIVIAASVHPLTTLLNAALGVVVGGGIFYALFQVSKGKWIGGGDVKLGWLLGLIVGTPGRAVLFIFLGSVAGTLISVPLLAGGRMKRTSVIPFGPFLIAGAIITVLFGGDIINWYQQTFINL